MEILKRKISEMAGTLYPEFVEYRRHFHRHPELSKLEHRTSAFIASRLEEWGIDYTQGIAGTGIVGIIWGQAPLNKVVALRSDMDALPINEDNDVPYKSQEEGVMHACGHDVHMASLLGTAKILHELRNEFVGTVKLIFQPSEEQFPGGALPMIREGVLQGPAVDVIFGQHTLPTLDAGKVGMKSGKYMASTDEVYIKVTGKGGHAATPELNVDPIPIAARIRLALNDLIVNRPRQEIPTLLAIGRFLGEGRTNIIPGEVRMEGTLRTFDEDWRTEVQHLITQESQSIAQEMGGKCEVFFDPGYPALENSEKITAEAFLDAQEFLGRENVVELNQRFTAEDFAYYLREVPGCFYRLGIRNEALGIVSNLHTDRFDVDEHSLQTGMGLMAWLAIKCLSRL